MADHKPQDAIALLKADHRKVEELFADYEKASGTGRKHKIAHQIALELTVHTVIEEEIFYPACEGKVDEDMIKEAYVEHDGAKVLMADLNAGDAKSDDYYDAKVKVLQEQIEHHVKEEEQRFVGIFSHARRAGLDMDELGERMARRKQELTAEYEKNGLPKPEFSTLKETSA